jgi:hypothetical protein
LFSPILRPSEVPGADEEMGSPFRFTPGAARTVSWSHNLHGFVESPFLAVEVLDLAGATVEVVVAERLDAVGWLGMVSGGVGGWLR